MGVVRPSYVEIDLRAIADNVATLADLARPSILCAVVKADAYGHGDVPVAETALASGASWLAVALVEEGIRLREAGIDSPILLLSEPPLASIARLVQWRLTPTVYRIEFAEALAMVGLGGPGLADRIPVHLKLDTGMHRVGADRGQAQRIAELISEAPNLRLEGLCTHFAVAETDREFTRAQLDRLFAFRDRLVDDGIDIPMLHAANTAGSFLGPPLHLDMVRAGIGIYGLYPDPATRPVALRPAMRVMSEVSHVQRLAAGARPSYGRIRPLPADANVATVPVGYADGLPRRLGVTGGGVLIHGRRFPYAGTVTMDQVVVDVGDEPVAVGDEVVLLGTQGDEEISADEWASRLDTINYEIVCQIGPRLPRRYLR